MASSSGPPRNHSKKMARMATLLDVPEDDPTAIDSELVPSSLASIAPILRAANEIDREYPSYEDLANLCRAYALEKADKLDPRSIGRDVRRFKTYLSNRLPKEDVLKEIDSMKIQNSFKKFYDEKNKTDTPPENMAKFYQIASVLHDVLIAVIPTSNVDDEVCKYARDIKKKKEHYAPYNILPLDALGTPPAIMKLPEIKAALNALRKLDDLPKLIVQSSVNIPHSSVIPEEGDRSIRDLLDWLWLAFGFQKGNVANQREHLILLLANIDRRNKHHGNFMQLDSETVKDLVDKIFKNYRSWCAYLHCGSNLKFPDNSDEQQLGLLYIGLYLLIWGEASNIRFMPECICYIFHNMAKELQKILYEEFQPAHHGEESFLQEVVMPIYKVVRKEALSNRKGTASHSKWRNYDDLNEYFWSDKCLKLKWPMKPEADFSMHSEDKHRKIKRLTPKTNFVEVRTFWHLFRSFDRMWIFFILAFQVMVIIAWSPSGSLAAIFDEDVFRSVLSIFITWALLNFFQASLDIVIGWKAWQSLRYTQFLRCILKFTIAAVWVVVLPIGYSSSVQNPTGLVKFFSDWGGNWQNQSFYNYAVAIYMMPNILAALLFAFPPLRRHMERSNWRIVILLLWWAQPKLFVGRGMHEDMFSLLKYTLFWIMLLIFKLAFSYYVEILPLIGPTKLIIEMRIGNYEWHEFFPNVTHNFGVVISIWVPIVLVYFMDTQIWYAIFSTVCGGILGAFSHLGEIRTLGMLRSRFYSVPRAFSKKLVPSESSQQVQEWEPKNIAKFSLVWNKFINRLRKEDLINNKKSDPMHVPYSSGDVSVVHWPPFLLASKIPIAVDMAKDFKGKDDELFEEIKHDTYMHSAVIECYEILRSILSGLLNDGEKQIIGNICSKIDDSIRQKKFLKDFRMSELPQLSIQLEKLLNLVKGYHEEIMKDNYEDVNMYEAQIIYVLQDAMEIITQDIISNQIIMGRSHQHMQNNQNDQRKQTLKKLMKDAPWLDKVDRLHLLLTVKESAINVPMNLEARRRITFFTNSLFMDMPSAPKVHDMLSFSVLTPYYKEDVLYSDEELKKENEDGISILFYLQKIYPDEWSNFIERVNYSKKREKERRDLACKWVSYRGQTLFRTVRGMMYYRKALKLQCSLDGAEGPDIFGHYGRGDVDHQDKMAVTTHSEAVADMKFTYVVSCQVYGAQKKSSEARDRSCYQNILNLMLKYPSLRVAYIDEREEAVNGKSQKFYYSVLVKGRDTLDEEIYRIKLPGNPIEIGEGKPENQNHAIIFTRGEALQTIDMNQDSYLEEAFKMRNVLEEFQNYRHLDLRQQSLIPKYHHARRKPSILGLREHIFTGSVSSLAWFMSNQETSFVTIGQRILASPLRVRFHYGHPDIFDRIFHLTRGGFSKASKGINLSEDIFAGFNSTLRGGYITHHEYLQVGKGRDVGMNQISIFEAKVANGNGEQTLSRDVYRLGRRFDFYRMLSFYFTTVGFYFSSMVTVLTVYVFLYGRLYMVLSGLEKAILEDPSIKQSKSLESALAAQSVFQLGLLLVLPMVMEIGLERGFHTALGDFIVMQLQLASVFFTFQLGTKAHYYGRTILHGGSKYRATGRGFVVCHAKFADNYRFYSRSHFVKGLELMILLIVYQVYGNSYRSSKIYFFVTFSMWFLVASWLFAPFIFNPSGFEWQKTVDDWTEWKRWMGHRGGIGIQPDRSWESWWDSEQEHLKHTDIWGRVLEIILACRFLVYQYGIVYHLNIAHHSKSVLVYGLSWFVMAAVLLVLKTLSVGRRRFFADFQLMFRILKGLLFFGFISVMIVLFVVCGLTISDLFAGIIALMPTGWTIILIGQACKPLLKNKLRHTGFWDSIKELARAYEYTMGLIIFLPVVILSWFPFVSEFQTRLLFNQAFSRGLQISMILAGQKDKMSTD